MRRHYAHSLEGRPTNTWEPLEEHLRRVAELAGQFAERFGAGEWGRVAGLWHDVGKYREEFQQRLHDASIHAPHAGAGAALAADKDLKLGTFLAFVIAGHHTGLANLGDSTCPPTPLKEVIAANRELVQRILPSVERSIRDQNVPQLPAWLEQHVRAFSPEQGFRSLAFFTRMLFSALVDGDRLKTAEFYADAEGRETNHAKLTYDGLDVLVRRLDRHIDAKGAGAKPTPINSLRAAVLADCRDGAVKRRGVFSLTVPTGGGKTLSAMSFALRHAIEHDLERVIVVIPFTSIITQNAERYKEAFGVDDETPDTRNVLEHHSAIDQEQRWEENAELELRRKTAAENWDAPVIVTTTVQFFETLFSNHPSRCRKLHRIARSVIILDEVQTLPPALLLPILEALRELVSGYGCSVVLSTATPPALQQRPSLPNGLADVEPIVAHPESLFASDAARRVTTEWRIDRITPYDEVAAEMSRHRQVLAIVHRRKDAHELARFLPEQGRVHLSALMCPAHRMQKIAEIEKRLRDGKPCRVVSTQLIEAGVDVDFPVVYRALAGLDSLAQSAGRCDREGLRTQSEGRPAGRFIIFRAPTAPPGETLRKAMDSTRTLYEMQDSDPRLTGGLDILNPQHALLFFEHFYERNRLDEKSILTALAGLNFATVDRDFQMIADQGMRSIVVPWGEGRERADRFQSDPTRQTQRALQPYLVQVNRRYFDEVAARGLVDVVDESIGLPTALFTQKWYTDEFGLEPDPNVPFAPDALIA